jgi:hypothetical protein
MHSEFFSKGPAVQRSNHRTYQHRHRHESGWPSQRRHVFGLPMAIASYEGPAKPVRLPQEKLALRFKTHADLFCL